MIIGDLMISFTQGFVSKVINDLFGSQSEDARKTLEQFLNIQSKDIVHKTEAAIREAFLNHKFDVIKDHTVVAMRMFSTYIHTVTPSQPKGEKASLNSASDHIALASASLLNHCESALQMPSDTHESILLNREKPLDYNAQAQLINCIVRDNKHLEFLFQALESVSVLDLMILITRLRQYPGIITEINRKISEYTAITGRLCTFYSSIQCLRVTNNFSEISNFKIYIPLCDAFKIDNHSLVKWDITPTVPNQCKCTFGVTYMGPPEKKLDYNLVHEVKKDPYAELRNCMDEMVLDIARKTVLERAQQVIQLYNKMI